MQFRFSPEYLNFPAKNFPIVFVQRLIAIKPRNNNEKTKNRMNLRFGKFKIAAKKSAPFLKYPFFSR